MTPRITLLTAASGNSSVRTWSPSARASSSEAGVLEPSSDASEESASEVDELDDSDGGAPDVQPQWAVFSSASAGAPSQKVAVKKPRPKPPTTRVPGQTIIPVSRVEAILVADVPHHGTVSKEASFLISLATEDFIRRLTRVANSRSSYDKRSLTTYNDLADSAYHFDEYEFLQEMIPRPLTPKVALAERKRILEERDALLNGVGSDLRDNSKYAQESASVSTSNASTPVPRLIKSKGTPHTSTKRKAPTKSKNEALSATTPVVRSERQKSKKARIEQASQVAEDLTAGTNTAPPPPSPAANGHAPGNWGSVNGAGGAGGMKIKIRPRVTSIASTNNASAPPPVLALGPPSHLPSVKVSPHEVLQLHSPRQTTEGADASLQFEEDAKSGGGNAGINGKVGNVQFAPVGVDASDQPLWTRVPLPPPPSAKVTKELSTYEDSKDDAMVTDLDTVAERARVSLTQRSSKAHTTHELEENAPNSPHYESNSVENASAAARSPQMSLPGRNFRGPWKQMPRKSTGGTWPRAPRAIQTSLQPQAHEPEENALDSPRYEPNSFEAAGSPRERLPERKTRGPWKLIPRKTTGWRRASTTASTNPQSQMSTGGSTSSSLEPEPTTSQARESTGGNARRKLQMRKSTGGKAPMRPQARNNTGWPIQSSIQPEISTGERVSNKGSLSDVLNGGLPNPGRTIYSER